VTPDDALGARRLDREDFSFRLCEGVCSPRRRVQLVIDEQARNRKGGKYVALCWQCYWQCDYWRLGPIVNCGALWDVIDARRDQGSA